MKQEKVWDNIAEEWHEFKKKQYPDFKEFIKNKKGKLLDLGCGSGRNFVKNPNLQIYGVDFSKEMLKLAKQNAKKKGVDVILKKSSVNKLSFKDNFFDFAIYISALHCLETKEKRENSLKELLRVLKPKSQTMISVWNRNSVWFKNPKKENYVRWRNKGIRYYYIYDKQELEDLLKKVGFKIIKSFEDKNIIFIVEKD